MLLHSTQGIGARVPRKEDTRHLHGRGNFVTDMVFPGQLERVWEIFADMPSVAACLPGAEIGEHTPTSLKGKINTRIGPMRAAFAGGASLKRDDSKKRGLICGAGTDSLSGSRARGDISYQLIDVGNGHTRVQVMVDYTLQGPLAQFSRGGLVKEFVKKNGRRICLQSEYAPRGA